MKSITYCGLDIHRDKYVACLMDKEGKEIKTESFPANKEAIESFFHLLLPKETVVTIENTGCWRYCHKLLRNLGFEVKLADAIATKKLVGKKKTDYYDAKALADLTRSNLLPELYIPNDDILKYRNLIHHLKALRDHKKRLKNQIKSELLKEGVPYKDEIWNIKGIAWLKTLKLPLILSLLELYEKLELRDKQVFKEVEKVSTSLHETELLMQIPGVGPYLSLIIYSELADIKRFASVKKLSMYAGVCPGVFQTGTTSYSVRSTRYSRILKWALHTASGRAVTLKKKNKFRKKYDQLKLRKSMPVARRVIARDLLTIIYHMLSRDEDYKA